MELLLPDEIFCLKFTGQIPKNNRGKVKKTHPFYERKTFTESNDLKNLEISRKFSRDAPILDQNAVQPLFPPSHCRFKTGQFCPSQRSWFTMPTNWVGVPASLEVIGWSVHLGNPVSYLRTYIVHICIFKTPLISLFLRDIFPILPSSIADFSMEG